MKEQSKLYNGRNWLTILLFIIYLIVIAWILLFKLGVHFSNMGKRNLNFIPFNGRLILNSENISNIVIFVPLGLYAGILFERWSFGKKILFFLLLSFIVEALQYILRIGVSDVTDIITNTLGGVIGLLLFKAIDNAFNNSIRAQKFINIMAAAGTFLMILLLVLLKMNMLPVKYR